MNFEKQKKAPYKKKAILLIIWFVSQYEKQHVEKHRENFKTKHQSEMMIAFLQ